MHYACISVQLCWSARIMFIDDCGSNNSQRSSDLLRETNICTFNNILQSAVSLVRDKGRKPKIEGWHLHPINKLLYIAHFR